MASPYSRKVDQQCLYLKEILGVVKTLSEPLTRRALIQAGYLQLEMALRFYLFELTAHHGSSAVSLGALDSETIDRLYQQAQSIELNELKDLLQDRRSWLTVFMEQLNELRQVDLVNKLKGSIFQLDEEESALNLIATSDISVQVLPASFDDLSAACDALQQLITRQRSVSVEY